jgi:glutamate dehydrogenase
MDAQFLNDSNKSRAYRLETYRSAGNVSSTIAQQLRCYFISKCDFVEPNPAPGETDIRKVSDKRFLEKVSENTLSIYQDIMTEAMERTGPVVEWFEVEGTREKRLVIGYKHQTTQHFFSALSKLYHWFVHAVFSFSPSDQHAGTASTPAGNTSSSSRTASRSFRPTLTP